MRVGLLIYNSLDTISGGYLYDRKLVEHLQRQGDEVQVISLPWRNYPRHLVDNFSQALRQCLELAPIDILLQDELNHPSLFWINPQLRANIRYPIVTIVHHLRCSELRPAWQNRLIARVERRYLKGVDGFIFNSQTTRQVVSQIGIKLDRYPSIVAYPAGDRFNPQINAETIQQRTLQPGPLRLVFLGNLIPRKGLHTLLAALRRLPLPAWHLAVAGRLDIDPAYTQSIRSQIRSAGMEHNVRLLGPLEDEMLAAELKTSHLLAVPSSYEGFGIIYLEGMSFGLPAIATTAGAAGEIITHERDGFLVSPGDTTALAECIRQVERDRQRLLEMSLAAHQRFLVHPTWEQSLAQIRKFLQSLL
jgi:glycosyltransferase involved in cell wall biosynthesis